MTRPTPIKTALVTGSGGFGIGTATARLLAKQGLRVYLNGRNPEALQQVAKLIAKEGGSCRVVAADISDPAQVHSMLSQLVKQEGGLDVLINNASPSMPFRPVDQVSNDAWHGEIDTILNGSFYCCREAAKAMQTGGAIIFISSVAALQGSWGRAIHYTAAKAALHGMAKQLALELASEAIRVNVIAPGLVDTPRTRQGGRRDDAWIADYCQSQIPLGRLASPADIAALAAFLASPQASYITGQVMVVDGGASLASKSMQPLRNI